jgi:nucleoside-diphosphate-sugar epimerase
MSIFLTGGTGFIGGYVLRMLVERGEQVHLIAREPDTIVLPAVEGIRVFRGDLRNKEDVVRAMRGTTRAIHLASLVAAWASDPAVFHENNVIGTRNFLEAALQFGLDRTVYTSTFSAVTVQGNGLADESCLVRRKTSLSEYGRSKILAEEEAEAAIRQGLPLVTVYPTRVYGIGPLRDANPVARALHLYMRGRLPFTVEHGEQSANWVLVDDVARGIVLALEHGRPGEGYILGGENLTVAQVFSFVDSVTKRKQLKINLPANLALALGSLEEMRAKLCSSRAFITRGWVKMLLESVRLSSAKAVEELGYATTPWQKAMERTVLWLNPLVTAH